MDYLRETVPSIEKLFQDIRTMVDSEDNARRNGIWKSRLGSAEAYWHGVPKEGLEHIPITIDLEHSMWGKLLGFDLDAYYSDPAVYLSAELQTKIYRFNQFSDDTPIGKSISIWAGSGFEASLFGMKQKYEKDQDPWVGREPCIKDKKDLDTLTMPDFYNTPPMPEIHNFYGEMKGLLKEDLTVIMLDWCRGPFGLACHLRGMDQIVVDMIQDPPFVHNLMSFLIAAQKKWKKQRAEFMGVSIQPACLYNDEVNIPTLSPQLYEQFVLPYEIKLSEYHNGISYWHSCGNTTLIQNALKNIPNLEMIHVSPWTDLKKTAESLHDSGIALEIALHPLNDVQKVSRERIMKSLRSIKEFTEGLRVTVRADAFEVISSLDNDIAKIKEWGLIARSAL